jgi:hypothetical protein
MNTIVDPSGDQAGLRSSSLSLVTRRGLAPFASTTQMSDWPASVRVKRMRRPSGDHDGDASAPSSWMSGRASLPSAVMIQIFDRPDLLDVSRICRPSPEKLGSPIVTLVFIDSGVSLTACAEATTGAPPTAAMTTNGIQLAVIAVLLTASDFWLLASGRT